MEHGALHADDHPASGLEIDQRLVDLSEVARVHEELVDIVGRPADVEPGRDLEGASGRPLRHGAVRVNDRCVTPLGEAVASIS
jgi:hypothetical protein